MPPLYHILPGYSVTIHGYRERVFFRSVKRNQGRWSVANRRKEAPLSDRNAKNSLSRSAVNSYVIRNCRGTW